MRLSVTDLQARTAIQESAVQILEEIGEPPDLTLVRGRGNWGDHLILEGTRSLLSSRVYREIDTEAVCAARGHTALLNGGGAFCRTFNDLMPRVLSIASRRFERVIVLPTSFDPSDDVVREALLATRATVFARETESYRRIRSLCDARLAHDCAFFVDYAPYRRPGRGVLNAFRSDPERLLDEEPEGNQDISETATSLEQWLETIAAHELIRTDRAHVMIAAAMLGKRVEFAAGDYHKVQAIARYALADRSLTEISTSVRPHRRFVPTADAGPTRDRDAERGPAPRVTAIVLVRERLADALRAIDTLSCAETPLETLAIDNNSSPGTASALADACARRGGVRLHRSDRSLGSAGGRALGEALSDSELVLFLDEDAAPEPGALDHLVAELDQHPGAGAVAATVLSRNGTVEHSGGWSATGGAIADFRLIAAGEPPEAVPPSGPADWVPGTAVLIRRSLLRAVPLDTEHRGAGWDLREWCHRAQRADCGGFRRSREARVVLPFRRDPGPGLDFLSRAVALESLQSHARFYERHGLLLVSGLGELVPELLDLDGKLDETAARLLMELMLARGADWTLMEWMNGGLEPLFSGRVLREHEQRSETMIWLQLRNQTLERIEQGGWWRLRGRLLPVLGLWSRLRGRSDGV